MKKINNLFSERNDRKIIPEWIPIYRKARLNGSQGQSFGQKGLLPYLHL